MSNPNQPSTNPPEDFRAYLARRAAEAAADQQATVEAATTHFDDVEKTALNGLAKIVEDAKELPVPGHETLGPLWPGANPES